MTSTIMADCTFLEQSFSHFIPELAGSIISTLLIAIGLFSFDWRMAMAALWVLPVSFAIVGFSAKVQERLNQKAMAFCRMKTHTTSIALCRAGRGQPPTAWRGKRLEFRDRRQRL